MKEASRDADEEHHRPAAPMRTTIAGWACAAWGSVVVSNTPSFRGAIKKVLHLVRVEEDDHG
jgi:hypothetical protein